MDKMTGAEHEAAGHHWVEPDYDSFVMGARGRWETQEQLKARKHLSNVTFLMWAFGIALLTFVVLPAFHWFN